jgi:hypothetical protein
MKKKLLNIVLVFFGVIFFQIFLNRFGITTWNNTRYVSSWAEALVEWKSFAVGALVISIIYAITSFWKKD